METGPRLLTETDLNTYDVTATTQYGAQGVTQDGRIFRYGAFGGTSTINPGLVLVGPTAPANSTGLAINTTSATNANTTANLQVGSKQLWITNGATAVTANQFQFVEIIVSAGGLYKLRLDGMLAAGNAGAVLLQLRDPLPQNITQLIPGTDTVNLRLSLYNGMQPSTTAGGIAGATINAVPNTATVTNYGWVQTTGHIYLSSTSAIAQGAALSQDVSGTAGFVITEASSSFAIGFAQYAAASNRVSSVLDLA